MRIVLAILSSGLLLLGSWRDAITLLQFKINQKRIAAEWCINRFTPELMCAGSCYLNTQLARNNDAQQGKDAATSSLQRDNSFFFLPLTLIQRSSPQEDASWEPAFHKDQSLSFQLPGGIFRPPRG